jgi:DNA-nicking Smr family endonuclease
MTKPTPKDRPPGRALGKAETELWRQVTGDVDPLPETHDLVDHPAIDSASPPSDKPSAESNDAAPPVSTPPLPPLRPEAVPEPALTHGSAPGLDRRTEINLRRGKVGIEARIDLHGMTQEQAHRALGDFLADQQAAGRRSVLVITGKGAGGTGILREAVPQWLNQDANRKRIRAFSHAQPKDGGEGALYVLLKRLK